jgi:anti-anti-sigma factor
VHCNGRIVAGGESESLRAHLARLLRDRRSIVLHLRVVGSLDSSGLGTMIRTLTSTRQVHGDLKLCNVPEHVRNVLELSHGGRALTLMCITGAARRPWHYPVPQRRSKAFQSTCPCPP